MWHECAWYDIGSLSEARMITGGRDEGFKIRCMFRLWLKTRQGEWQREVDYWCKAQRHCRHHKDPEEGTQRSRGGGVSLPLPNVGKGLPSIVHYWQGEPKEPHLSRGHEVDGLTDHSASTIVHHRVASRRTRYSHEPAMLPSIQHQALHGWGIVWHYSSWSLWCIITTTILVEVICFVFTDPKSHFFYSSFCSTLTAYWYVMPCEWM